MRDFIKIVESNLSPETWGLYFLADGEVNIGWQNDKDVRNRNQHEGLSLSDGIPVLQDPFVKTKTQIVDGEERIKYVGEGNFGKILTCVVQWIHDTGEELSSLRIISVFPADKKDRMKYIMKEDISKKINNDDEDESKCQDLEAWPFPSDGDLQPGLPDIKRRMAIHRAAYLARKNKEESKS